MGRAKAQPKDGQKDQVDPGVPALTFGKANAKLQGLEKRLGKKVYSFSLLSGHTCPYAKDCHAKAVPTFEGKWKIVDGEHMKFRCFSASEEVLYPSARESRVNNMQLVELAAKSMMDAHAAIILNLPKNCEVLRIHVGGDFKTQSYFDTWMYYAKLRPDITLYAYTKSLPFWIKRLDEIPDNFLLTASRGGYKDELIQEYGLREAIVVNPEEDGHEIIDAHTAVVDGIEYEIDHDDHHAATTGGSFALVLHGIQPKGTKAAAGLKRLKGFGSYNDKKGANTVYVAA